MRLRIRRLLQVVWADDGSWVVRKGELAFCPRGIGYIRVVLSVLPPHEMRLGPSLVFIPHGIGGSKAEHLAWSGNLACEIG
jgi:hypothetical protein